MLPLALALLCFAAAAYLLAEYFITRRRCSETVTATVLTVERNRPGRMQKETRNFYPVYRFVLRDREYEVRPDEPSRTNQWTAGQTVTLHVDPENPDRFTVDRRRSDLLWGIAALCVGVLMLAVWRMY